MIDRDIVLAKVAIIQRCLDRIRSVTGMDPASLDDIDRQNTIANCRLMCSRRSWCII